MAAEHDLQRITRLTPLADVLARIDAMVKPVAPRRMEIDAADGRVLAEDVVAPLALPMVAHALRDGYAVSAEALRDASPYAPVPLAAPPVRVEVGAALPADTDAVAPLDSVVERASRFEAIAAVAAGDGVLPSGADVRGGERLRTAGSRLRAIDIALLSAARLDLLSVREPRVRVVNTRGDRDTIMHAAHTLIVGAVARASGESVCDDSSLADAFARADADAIVALGGTGSGRADASVRALAQAGRVEMHGVALLPGETATFGLVGDKPVLLLPGRLDAALAVWVTLGRHLLARLSGCTEESPGTTVVLARKVASPLGFAEIVPVRCRDRKAEPIASGYWPLSAIAQSDGWIMVPADSEGYPAGAAVVLRPWA